MTTRTDVLRIRIETDNDGNARASLAGVADSADKVAQSTGGAATATTTNTEAMKASAQAAAALTEVETARAETEAEAIARIHAMVEASLSVDEVTRLRAEGELALGAAQERTTAITAEQVAAQRALAAAQTEAMNRYALQMAPMVQLNALLEKRTLTSAEVAAAEQALDEAQARGIISAGELAAAFQALDAAKIKDTAATQANTVANVENAASHINSRTAYSIDAALSDLATGQFSRTRREAAALANETGLLQKIMSPTGLAIGGVVVALGLFGKAVYDREQDLLAFNKALAATGDFAGTTGLQLQGIASLVGSATGRYDDATKAVLALAQSGDVLGSQLQNMATIAVNMAYLTGESVDKIVKELISLQGDPTAAIAKTTAAMGLLTTAQFNQIVETQQQQGATAGAALAMKDLEAASDSARQRLVENAGIVSRFWGGVKDMFSELGREIASIGAQTSIDVQIAQMQVKLAGDLKIAAGVNSRGDPHPSDPEKNDAVIQDRAALAALQQQQKSDAMFAHGQELANQAKQKHDQALAEALAYNKQGDEGFVAQADAINQKRLMALIGIVDPAIKDRINAAYDQQIRDAVKRANSAYQGGSSGGTHVPHDKGPAALASFSQYVGNLTAQSQGNQMDDSAIGKYVTGVEKLDAAFNKAIMAHADLTAATAKYDQGIQALGNDLAKAQAKETAADVAFKAQLDDQLALRKQAIDLQVQSIGMGAKEVQRMQELNQVQQQFDQQLAQLNRERDRGSISLQQYNDRLDALKTNEQATINAALAGYARADAAMADWRNGALRAMEDMRDQFSDVAGQVDQTFTNAFSNMNQAIVQWVQTGKFSGKQFADNLISDLMQIELHVLESKILNSILSALAPSGAGIASSYMAGGGASYAASGVNWNVSLGGSANGNAFDTSGALTAFANGAAFTNSIVSQPTLFAFANGTGLMGERGPEAIMPLSRGADGKLGVVAQGGGGNVQVIVENHSDSKAEVQQSKDMNGGDIIKVIVGQAVSEVNKQIGRGGSTYKVMQQTFGLSRRGVPVTGG